MPKPIKNQSLKRKLSTEKVSTLAKRPKQQPSNMLFADFEKNPPTFRANLAIARKQCFGKTGKKVYFINGLNELLEREWKKIPAGDKQIVKLRFLLDEEFKLRFASDAPPGGENACHFQTTGKSREKANCITAGSITFDLKELQLAGGKAKVIEINHCSSDFTPTFDSLSWGLLVLLQFNKDKIHFKRELTIEQLNQNGNGGHEANHIISVSELTKKFMESVSKETLALIQQNTNGQKTATYFYPNQATQSLNINNVPKDSATLSKPELSTSSSSPNKIWKHSTRETSNSPNNTTSCKGALSFNDGDYSDFLFSDETMLQQAIQSNVNTNNFFEIIESIELNSTNKQATQSLNINNILKDGATFSMSEPSSTSSSSPQKAWEYLTKETSNTPNNTTSCKGALFLNNDESYSEFSFTDDMLQQEQDIQSYVNTNNDFETIENTTQKPSSTNEDEQDDIWENGFGF